jgi:hypothetical protein
LLTTRRTVYSRHHLCKTLLHPPRMRAATGWPRSPHPSVHPIPNTGNAVSGVITNSHRPLSTTQITIGLRRSTAARLSRTPRSVVTSPVRAVSGVFDELWNCPKSKAAGINQLVSEIDLYPSNDLTSRPLNSTNRPINLHTLISATILIAPHPALLTATPGYNYSFS